MRKIYWSGTFSLRRLFGLDRRNCVRSKSLFLLRMAMAAPMRPNSPSRGPKRARPDHSASASPAREVASTSFNHEDGLPAFLRQSIAGISPPSLPWIFTHVPAAVLHKRVRAYSGVEINLKFELLNAQQLQRLEQSRTGSDQDSQWAIDLSLENRLRNRYLDIRPWERQRIKLQVPEGTSDYINASPINLPSTSDGNERKYIATQVSYLSISIIRR